MKTIVWFAFVLGALSAAGKVIVTKQGQRVMLECGVSTYSTVLEWNCENGLLFSTSKSQRLSSIPRKGKSDIAGRSNVRQETKLEISEVKMGDAGKFTCKADGKSFEHTLLVVSVSASPSGELQLGSKVTLRCQVGGLNPPDSTVQWKGPGRSLHAGPQTELNPVARSDAGTWNCTFSYNGVMYSESIEIKVREPETTAPSPTQRPNDNHNPSCHDCVTHHKPDAALLLGLNWWMWVAIGVGCLLMLLLIVLIIVLCKSIKRRKRKFQTKNGGLPMKPKKYCQCNRPAAAAKPQQGRRREKPSAPPLQPLLME